ncbi:MAG: hypothetical protein QG657_4159 [Acidobacteriota bacterium]|nr:hypothetical protein [Acidobacteriota bacterium]
MIDTVIQLTGELGALVGIWGVLRGSGVVMDFKAVAFEAENSQFQVDGAVFLMAQDLVHGDLLEHQQGID